MSQFSAALREACQPGLRAVKSTWGPFVAIQLAAVALVVSYYQAPGVHQSLEAAEEFKRNGGLWVAAVAGMIAGGILPEFAKLASGRLKKFDGDWIRLTAFTTMVYGIIGVQIDLWYRLQTLWFGEGRDWGTLLTKTAVDQIFFAPLVAIPTAVFLFAWRKEGLKPALEVGTPSGWMKRVFPAMIPCWALWIPVLFCCYAMPTDLQFFFSMLAEAAWSVIFVFMMTDDQTHA